MNHITVGHLSHEEESGKRSFQPMNVNFGLFPTIDKKEIKKPEGWEGRFRGPDKAKAKKRAYTDRGKAAMREWLGLDAVVVGE